MRKFSSTEFSEKKLVGHLKSLSEYFIENLKAVSDAYSIPYCFYFFLFSEYKNVYSIYSGITWGVVTVKSFPALQHSVNFIF